MALSRADKDKLLQKMRNNKAKKEGFRDPTEWRPKFNKEGSQVFRIYVLMQLVEGDKCLGKDGSETVCKKDWDLYYFQRGNHWVDKKTYECPRVRDGGDCPMCSAGFDLMREIDDKDARKAIAKEWLSQENHIVNVYFPDHKDNPKELRGEVKWWRVPMGIWNQCEEALERNDDGGDEDDPKPFGLFFDPSSSFPIKISLQEKAGYNNYDGSKMLGKPYPIDDDEDKIETILAKRIDVQTKFPDPNIEDLKKLVDSKLSSSSTGDSGFDDDEEKESKKKDSKPVEESKSKSKSKDEDDDDDNNDESKSKAKAEDDDDDKPEEKSKSKAKAKDDDDDDDGELDDEMKKLLAELE